MPEGHAIERIRQTFQDSFVGKVCRVSSPQGRFDAGAALLDGLRITDVAAHGKHLFVGFSPDAVEDPARDTQRNAQGNVQGDIQEDILWLHVHLGLYGGWRFHYADGVQNSESAGQEISAWEPPIPSVNARVRILTEDCAADLAGPTACEVLTTDEVNQVLKRLGPDPLKNLPADRERFVDRVRASKRPVGELIMDQSIAAGVGNIFRAESLFRVGISPGRAGARVPRYQLAALWDDLVVVMNRAVQSGLIITTEADDEPLDEESESWYVYHRAGKQCLKCENMTIRTRKAAGRNLFWCSTCQR